MGELVAGGERARSVLRLVITESMSGAGGWAAYRSGADDRENSVSALCRVPTARSKESCRVRPGTVRL